MAFSCLLDSFWLVFETRLKIQFMFYVTQLWNALFFALRKREESSQQAFRRKISKVLKDGVKHVSSRGKWAVATPIDVDAQLQNYLHFRLNLREKERGLPLRSFGPAIRPFLSFTFKVRHLAFHAIFLGAVSHGTLLPPLLSNFCSFELAVFAHSCSSFHDIQTC